MPGPIAFTCTCGNPLFTAPGTPSVVCPRCNTTILVPAVQPGAPPPAPPAKRGGIVPFVIAGIAGIAAIAVQSQGKSFSSDSKTTTNITLALAALAVVMVVIGISRRGKG